MPVVINSKFTPLTYDEITKPLIQQTEAQAAMEEAYTEASDKAAELMAKANQQTDPVAYNKLKAYSEDLQRQADHLMKNGLQSGSRQALFNMKRRYGTDIVPIKAAADRREELAKEQRALQAKNPRLRFQNDVRTASLDAFLNNPSMDYGASIDLEDLSKRAESIVSAIDGAKQELRITGNLDKFTKQVQQYGLTMDDITAIVNDRDGSTTNGAIMRALYNSTGVQNWNNKQIAQDTWGAIQEGAYRGLGARRVSTTPDFKAQLDAQKEAAIDKIIARKGNGKVDTGKYIKDADGNYVDPIHGYKFKLDANGEPVFVGYMTKPSSSRTSTSRGSAGSSETVGDSDAKYEAQEGDSVGEEVTSIDQVPLHVRAKYGQNQQGVHYFPIRRKKSRKSNETEIVGWRVVKEAQQGSTEDEEVENFTGGNS